MVMCETSDKYADLVVCAISSIVPPRLSANEVELIPDKINNLRAISVVKVDRIITIKRNDVIAQIGELDRTSLSLFTQKFKALVD